MSTELFKVIVKYLDDQGLDYELFEHSPVFTSVVASQVSDHPPEEGTKSLALQGKNGVVVATVAGHERVDFRQIAALVGEKKLKMAKAGALDAELRTEVGGLAPFGYGSSIPLVVSESLFGVANVFFNPGRNDATIRISGVSFRKIMGDHGATVVPASDK